MRFMKKDGRKLSHKVREKIRIRTVLNILEREKEIIKAKKRGEVLKVNYGKIAKELELHRSSIYNWMARYREGGMDKLKTQAKKIPGRPPILKKSQLNKLYNLITSKSPLQFQFESALWTRSIVQDLVFNEFAVTLSTASTGRLLKSLGLSPRKPVFRKWTHNMEGERKWLIEDYPAVCKKARSKGARIYATHKLTIKYGERRKLGLNLMSATSPKGKELFMVIEGAFTSEKFIGFIKALIQDIDEPIFLMVDNHRIYKSIKVREFVNSTEDKLSLFYLLLPFNKK